jgi:hypothetical protein
MNPMATRASFSSRMALAVCGIVAALLVGEALIRLFDLAPESFVVYASRRGWRPKPGAHGWQRREGQAYVSVNRHGFRGPDRPVEKPAGGFRVAVLGDSFAFAEQVPYRETFSAVVERRLTGCAALSGRPVEVLDFGCIGYGTAQELLTLRRQAWRYAPDMVVLAVYTGNDIRNNSPALERNKCRPFFVYRGGRLELGGPFVDSAIFRLNCLARYESRRLQVFNVLGDAWMMLRDWLRSLRGGASARRSAQFVAEDLVTYRPPAAPAWREAWRVTEGEIELMRREVASRDAGFLVTVVSDAPQVFPSAKARLALVKSLGASGDLLYPDKRLVALGRREGFAVLDLVPAMQAWADAKRRFLHGFANSAYGSGHWNAEGHRLAGELIAERLCAMAGRASAAPR